METKDIISIEQMKELESLGIDTSDATCMWTSIQNEDYEPIRWLPVFRGDAKQPIEVMRENFPLTYKDGNIYYAYTLLDLLSKFKIGYTLDWSGDEYTFINTDDDGNIIIGHGDTVLDAIYDAFKKTFCQKYRLI